MIQSLAYNDEDTLDYIKRQTSLTARIMFGNDNVYQKDLSQIYFHPIVYVSNMPESSYRRAWQEGSSQLLNLVETMKDEYLLKLESSNGTQENPNESERNFAVFLVHGHDGEMKQSVARFLERIGFDVIILHEQPSAGMTIIEKLSEFGGKISYAIVLFSPDDIFVRENEKEIVRARQNVIFELGYFIGRLGRTNVTVLHKVVDDFEIFSDYSGVLYIPFEENDSWKMNLARELSNAGFDLDFNKVYK